MTRLPLITAMALLAVGCGPAEAIRGIPVSRGAFESTGRAWPLSVESGHVGCSKIRTGQRALWFTAPDEETYALNSWALADGIQELRPIWLEDQAAADALRRAFPEERITVPKISIFDLMAEAKKDCEP